MFQRNPLQQHPGWLRLLMAILLVVLLAMSGLGGVARHSYAQALIPQSDEFNATTFSAPFQVVCAAGATQPCPDSQDSQTWSLDRDSSGVLRIWTLPGAFAGPGATASTVRNLVLQPFDPSSDWTSSTRMTFPAAGTSTSYGQAAGILIYGDDQHYVYLGRQIDRATASSLRFVQDSGGEVTSNSYTESPNAPPTIYLALSKTGNLYQPLFSYDGITYTPMPLHYPAGNPSGYTATYSSPRIGLFAAGGNADPGAPPIAADFDWFHVTILVPPTATATPSPTSTPSPTATPTPATVALSTTSGQPGSNVVVTGSGYAPGESVDVRAAFPLYNGNTLTVTRTGVAGSDGALNPVLLTVPQGARKGSVPITATGAASNRTGSATLTVVYHPSISATGAVPPGGTITVNGHGFVANSTVKVSISTTTESGATSTRAVSTLTDGSGRFQTSLTLASTTRPGTYTLTTTDVAGTIQATTRVTVALNPTISLSKASALPSHTITITGAGFTANVPVHISATFPLYGGGSQTVTVGAMTSKEGTFTAKLTVPARAASGSVSIIARTAARQLQKTLAVRPLTPAISVSPAGPLPGSSVAVHGTGYLPGSVVHISVPVTLLDRSGSTLTGRAVADSQGAFTVTLAIPGNVQGGTYTIAAQGSLSGRTARTTLAVTKLAPSIVPAPATLTPGTQTTVTGFGFAAGSTVTLSIAGQSVGTATTDATGHFSVQVTVPQNLPSGTVTLSAESGSRVHASASLTVNRNVARRFYFASLYTGHQEYLALLNPTSIQARVTITYQLTTGATRTKTVTIKPHSRATENVNADLGSRVSTAATVSGDVPIVASRVAYRGSAGTVVPGTESPATTWYFADGNTSHNYVEYIAIQNPGSQPARVALHIMPTHHPAFTEYRTVQPTSRLTIKVNKFVRDAVGVIVNANAPVVANRTMRIHQGMTSKIGTNAPQSAWYFADGSANATARHWIAITNPSNHQVYLTLQAYNAFGAVVGTVKQWLKPNAREGYLMNKLAGTPSVAVVARASGPIVAEQTSYANGKHNQYTATFGAAPLSTSWAFAAANTSIADGQSDTLSLFNPNQSALPIVVQFMDSSGKVTSRTYVVGPMAHQRIDVASVVPATQLGLVVSSNQPFAALNRYTFNRGSGGATSIGVAASGH